MKPKKNNTLIIAILTAALLITGALVFLGLQLGKSGSGNLQAEIEKGIQAYVTEQQKNAAQAAATANQPKIVEGDFTDDDPFMGEEDAPVVLIEWSDYQCPFCRRFYNDTLPQIKENYIDTGKLKFVYRDFPLSFHANAKPYAMAAECAREQGGDKTYFEYHDLIFEEQNKLGQGTVSVSQGDLKIYAQQLGLNRKKFDECLDTEKYADEVNKDFQDGQNVGVNGTPGFLLNGRLISGAQPYTIFEAVIEQALNQ